MLVNYSKPRPHFGRFWIGPMVASCLVRVVLAMVAWLGPIHVQGLSRSIHRTPWGESPWSHGRLGRVVFSFNLSLFSSFVGERTWRIWLRGPPKIGLLIPALLFCWMVLVWLYMLPSWTWLAGYTRTLLMVPRCCVFATSISTPDWYVVGSIRFRHAHVVSATMVVLLDSPHASRFSFPRSWFYFSCVGASYHVFIIFFLMKSICWYTLSPILQEISEAKNDLRAKGVTVDW